MITHLMSSLINRLETKTSTSAFIQANSQVEAAKVENSPKNTNVTEILADPTGKFNMLLILRSVGQIPKKCKETSNLM